MPRGTRVQIHTPVEAVHKLPVFQHVPEPLVAPELFRPVLHKRLLPQGLTALLIPSADQYQPREKLPVGPVDVWCGEKQVSVRVDRLQLRHWTTPSLFRLGSCPVSGVSPRYLYFHHRLTECSGHPKVWTQSGLRIIRVWGLDRVFCHLFIYLFIMVFSNAHLTFRLLAVNWCIHTLFSMSHLLRVP